MKKIINNGKNKVYVTSFNNRTALLAFLTALLGLAAVGADNCDTRQAIRHLSVGFTNGNR